MINAKDILVKLKGDNKNFKGAMTGANTSMKSFATTTTASTTVAATSTKAMALSMAASLAVATAGITVIIAGVMGLVSVLGKAGAAAIEDQEANSRMTAALESSGQMRAGVVEGIFAEIEALEKLTGIEDTAIQDTFTAFTNAGMEKEEAMRATEAATRLAANGVMTLEQSERALTKEFTGQTSKLKDTKVAGDDYDQTMANIFATLDDGTIATDNIQGKMKDLWNEILNHLKPLFDDLIPVVMHVLDAFIWGAQNVLPLLIRGFKWLMIPIKGVIMNLKQIYEVAKAAWSALTGDWEAAETHWDNVWKLQKEFNKESYNTLLNIKSTADAQNIVTTAIQESTDAQNEYNKAVDSGVSSTQSPEMRQAKRLQGLREEGISAEQYSGRTWYDDSSQMQKWGDIAAFEKKFDQKEFTGSERGQTTEIVDEVKTQTNELQKGNSRVLNELKIHTGLLRALISKIRRPSPRARDEEEEEEPLLDLGNVKSYLPYVGPPTNSGAP